MPGEEGKFKDELFINQVESFRRSFVRESWALYGIAVAVVLLRFIARYRRFGFRGMRTDDGLMVFALATFTVMTYGINGLLNRGAETAFVAEEVLQLMTKEDVSLLIRNAKWIYAICHLEILTLWSAKFCMVIIYLRITDGLVARRWLIAVGVYVGISFVGTELGLFLSCLPIERRWLPGMNTGCSFYDNYQKAEAVFSVTSTFMVLVVGLPVLLKARLPPRQKCIVLVLFGLGIFDLAADILNKVFITQVATYGFTYYSWYMRVTFVALLVCNLPYTWSLIIDTFPSIRTWSSEHSMDSTPKFWKESRWTHSYFCCADRRKDFAQAPSTIAKDAISEVDMKHPEAALAFIGRMIGGELEDEIDLDMITSRKVFLDIESAVAVARSQPMPPGYQTEAARMDSAMTPPNSAGLEEGFKSSPHRPSKGEMEVIN